MKKISKYLMAMVISFLAVIMNASADTQFNLKLSYPDNDQSRYSAVPNQQDNSKLYLAGGDYLYSYDFATGNLELIYTLDFSVDTAYMQGDVIYVSGNGIAANPQIVGVNVKEKKIVFDKTYNRSKIYGSFVVDKNQNVYFSDSDAIYIYDKDAKLIDSYENIGKSISLNSLNPDETILFVNMDYYHEGFFQVKNGHFVKKAITYFYQYRLVKWSFFANNKAINNYGEIVQFNDTLDNYSLKFQGSSASNYAVPTAQIVGNNMYMTYPGNVIYMLDKDTYEKKGSYKLDNGGMLYKFYVSNDKLYIVYKLDNYFYGVTYNLSDMKMSKNIELTTHTTLNYKKDDVINRYLNSLPKFNYNEDIFSSLPKTSAPYYEGVLKQGVVDDVLNQYNYYRYLSGLNEVSINTNKMPRSQKGALILGVTDSLTHTPSRPSDMDQTFYQEAYDGVYAKAEPGDTYSGNISGGTAVYALVKGFVDDSDNVFPNVGHRSSMLDPYAKSISFGFMPYKYPKNATYSYGAISVYYDNVNNNKDSYYAWPPAGYIPVESFPATTRTMWSVWLDSSYRVTSDTKVTITFRNKDYVINRSSLYYEDQTLYYYVPTALNNIIRTSFNEYLTDEPIKFKITGLEQDIDKVTISYTTTFVRGKTIALEDFKLFTSENEFTYSNFYESGTNNLKLNQTYKYLVEKEPRDATVDLEIKIGNSSLIELDTTNQSFKPIKGGDTTITITDKISKRSKTYKVHIDSPSTGVKLNKTEITLMPGETFNLEASLLPEGSTDPTNFTWSTNNNQVATVQNGVVKAGKEGNAKITVKTSKGYTAECNVIVASYIKGDLNENRKIEVADALEALYYSIGKRELTARKLAIGNFNSDSVITVYDALEILKLYVNESR